MDSNDQRRVAAITAAGARLRVDHAASAAIRALDLAGISSVVLKGPSIARWLYEPEDARTYADCDLLVRPDQFDAAVATLRETGFQPEFDEAKMPTWWREHALTTFSGDGGAIVDLHRNLPGVHVSDEILWSTLSCATEAMALGDVTAQILSPPGRLMHAALHAAQHGGSHRDIDVLARALDRVGEDTWRAAADLASTLQAEAAFTRGLTMVPAGVRLAQTLDLRPQGAIDVELRASRSTEALTIARLQSARGFKKRAVLVHHKLLPPVTFMLKWSPLARRGRLGLAAAYIYRPIWILQRTPGALSDWRQARRELRYPDDPDRSIGD